MLAELALEDDTDSGYWSYCLDSEVVSEQPASWRTGAASPGGVSEVLPFAPQSTHRFISSFMYVMLEKAPMGNKSRNYLKDNTREVAQFGV